MRRNLVILFLAVLVNQAYGQDTVRLSGQLSSWLNLNSENTLPLWGGIRYIPQLNYGFPPGKNGNFDTELSANLYANAGLKPFDTLSASAKIKPYRIWARYSTDQLEIRLGLQKLNFGSSLMLRPLMWFDQMDPRDPLQLTDGVWGILGRYYFLNNSNIWLWGLFGNNKPRGWETVPVNTKFPELGGRIQVPVPGGEAAITYHYRVADSRELGNIIFPSEKIPEHKIGFDTKWDLKAGIWLEGSYTYKRRNTGILTNQLMLNAGADYTFPAGNGIYAAFEQLYASFDEQPFSFSNDFSFSLLTISYPIGLFDRLSTIIYYNWDDSRIFSFINWQKQFDNVTLYVMAYWNPDTYRLPAQTSSQNIFAGRGIQMMFVFNH